MYETLARNLLFLLPPEAAHAVGMFFVKLIGFLHRLGLWQRSAWATHMRLRRETPFGTVSSPLGLAAGFDKNAECLWGWQALGFGFVEVGTVTPAPQDGNPPPRLFRFSRFKAIVNRMGFNNDGVRSVAARVRKARIQGLKIKVGGNIGKNKTTPLELAAEDYAKAARELRDCVDYLVINVSSPNTPGLRSLQDARTIDAIVAHVKREAPDVPLFIKVAPDNFKDYMDGVLAAAAKYSLAGIICGNTLANHASARGIDEAEIAVLPDGGLSGKPLFEINLKLCEEYAVSPARPFVVGVGGIESLADAVRYFQAGARLIQVYTGFVYGGPAFVKRLLKDLARNSEERNTYDVKTAPPRELQDDLQNH